MKNKNLAELIRRNPKIALRLSGKELIPLPTQTKKKASTYRP